MKAQIALSTSLAVVLLAGSKFITFPEVRNEAPSSIIQTTHNEPEMTNEAPTALVNYDYFESLVTEVKAYRSERLVNWNTFKQKSAEKHTIILDTRSKEMYDLKHIKGAIHLNFADFNLTSLAEITAEFAGTETQILIYCNNNFWDSKAIFTKLQDVAFISKSTMPVELTLKEDINNMDKEKSLALNIPTFINLYGYGYQNIYELNELIDVNDPKIEFEGTFDD